MLCRLAGAPTNTAMITLYSFRDGESEGGEGGECERETESVNEIDGDSVYSGPAGSPAALLLKGHGRRPNHTSHAALLMGMELSRGRHCCAFQLF